MVKALLILADVGHHMEWGEWGWFWMIIMMIVGAVIVAVVIYFLARVFYQGGISRTSSGPESPLDIAKRRYAAGEINSEEFEKIRQDIGGSNP